MAVPLFLDCFVVFRWLFGKGLKCTIQLCVGVDVCKGLLSPNFLNRGQVILGCVQSSSAALVLGAPTLRPW